MIIVLKNNERMVMGAQENECVQTNKKIDIVVCVF